MAVSVILNAQDEQLFKSYAKANNISLSELFRNAVFEKIEDEYDLMMAKEALFEFSMASDTFTAKEMQQKYNL